MPSTTRKCCEENLQRKRQRLKIRSPSSTCWKTTPIPSRLWMPAPMDTRQKWSWRNGSSMARPKPDRVSGTSSEEQSTAISVGKISMTDVRSTGISPKAESKTPRTSIFWQEACAVQKRESKSFWRSCIRKRMPNSTTRISTGRKFWQQSSRTICLCRLAKTAIIVTGAAIPKICFPRRNRPGEKCAFWKRNAMWIWKRLTRTCKTPFKRQWHLRKTSFTSSRGRPLWARPAPISTTWKTACVLLWSLCRLMNWNGRYSMMRICMESKRSVLRRILPHTASQRKWPRRCRIFTTSEQVHMHCGFWRKRYSTWGKITRIMRKSPGFWRTAKALPDFRGISSPPMPSCCICRRKCSRPMMWSWMRTFSGRFSARSLFRCRP